MDARTRTVEVHKLTISGLEPDIPYEQFVSKARHVIPSLKDTIWGHKTRSYGLHEARVVGRRLRMLFFSFTTGSRPDILDTGTFSISPNPLSENQTGIEWIHVLGGHVGDRFLLLFERSQLGIRPRSAEEYLQWLIDERVARKLLPLGGDPPQDITVSIEAVPGPEFIPRLDSLERVTKATLRTVRPNPGWGDLDSELGKVADDSSARMVDISMSSKPKRSLEKNSGIIAWIKDLFKQDSLDHATIEGVTVQKEKDTFTTAQLGLRNKLRFKLDDHGQVQHGDVWSKLGRMLEGLDQRTVHHDQAWGSPGGMISGLE